MPVNAVQRVTKDEKNEWKTHVEGKYEYNEWKKNVFKLVFSVDVGRRKHKTNFSLTNTTIHACYSTLEKKNILYMDDRLAESHKRVILGLLENKTARPK